MADEASSPNNVIVVSFEDDANAYEAMTKLKELDSQHQVDLRAAAIIVRHEDGQLEIKDEIAEDGIISSARWPLTTRRETSTSFSQSCGRN